ncbi:ribosome maturation factor RimP [Halonatronum saccharophilum]|uniref:ribosome maturation factor RimP n=1 Tax=Halonatronum saccharophilum TaxID=150060 RepID=UPI0004821871|nr:ribosome maturation factor RimP [Halonatronum saccharophilum]
MGRKVEEVVEVLVEPIANRNGLELVDIEYSKEGQDWILRVFIDKKEGVSLDDCQSVSRELSDILDKKDPIDKTYLLEVSSPGIDRPLKKDEDFIRFSGRKVDISTYAPINGEKKLNGELLGIDEGNIKLVVDGEELNIPREKVSQARLAVEF